MEAVQRKTACDPTSANQLQVNQDLSTVEPRHGHDVCTLQVGMRYLA